MHPKDLEAILNDLPKYREAAFTLRETLLANLVMVGEIPAPTFMEASRSRFLIDRFNECGLAHCSTDEANNAVGVITGTEGNNDIVLVAHIDQDVAETVDHTISVQPGAVSGPGVADNALGGAVLATLPTLFKELGINLRSNLVLLGAAQSLGRGNLKGVQFYLKNSKRNVAAGVAIEGVQLGQLCVSSIGMARGELIVHVPEEYDWTRFGAQGAIIALNEIVSRIIEIPLPRKPQSNIVLGAIFGGGRSYNVQAPDATLRFEIRSEDAEMVQQIEQQVEEIAAETSMRTSSEVTLDIFARRSPGGISFSHPLVRTTRQIMERLSIAPRIGPSTSELSRFLEHSIPAVRIGLTNGKTSKEEAQTIEIEPIATGMAQLVGTLLAIDGGYCYEA